MDFCRIFIGVILLYVAQLGYPIQDDQSAFMSFYDKLEDDYDSDNDYSYVSAMRTVAVRKNSKYGSSFDCRVTRTGMTNDVNKLSPSDVGVVAALGDSLTAAFGGGAGILLSNLFEYKGISWSIGGKESLSTVTTLPNILKVFNPGLYGYSKKTKIANSKEAFNRADTGAEMKDLYGEVNDLVKEMNSMTSKRMGVPNKWKVITIFMGSNDLCSDSLCKNSVQTTVRNVMQYLERALKLLASKVKKAFVNLALLLNVTILSHLYKQYFRCRGVHGLACKCAMKTNPSRAYQVYKALNAEIIKTYGMKQPLDRKDFTIVVQPLYQNTHTPPCSSRTRRWSRRKCEPEKSYLAPDCFHFNQRAHSLAASLLWNNMLQPVGKKSAGVPWGKTVPLLCPNPEFPYFRTAKNSQVEIKEKY